MMKIKEFILFLKDIWFNRALLFKLAKNDIKSRYAGSFFGIIWAFIQPLVTMFVFWFVFQVGFKNPPVANIEFILWLITGYIPWIYFSDGLMSSAGCLYEYGYLVKKVKFRTSLLPLVKILSAMFIHIFFIFFIWIMFLIYGHPFKMIWFQSIYFSFCLTFLLVGLSWIMSSVSVFFKDFSQIINIVLQIGFWVTPIFWDAENMKAPFVNGVLKVNPLYYVIQGYRDTFIDNCGIWHRPYMGWYFWIFSIVTFIAGAIIYRKLRPHFADVL